MSKYVTTIVEVVRLALAVLVYVWIEPTLTKVFHPADFIGMLVAAVISATVLLLLSALLVPSSEARIDVENFTNGSAVAGPVTEIEAPPMTDWVRSWQLNIHLECTSPTGRWIANRLTVDGLTLTVRIPYKQLILHSGDPAADEELLDDGLVISLGKAPLSGSWAVIPISVDTREIANGEFGIEAKFEYTGRARWLKKVLLHPVLNVNQIKLVRTSNV